MLALPAPCNASATGITQPVGMRWYSTSIGLLLTLLLLMRKERLNDKQGYYKIKVSFRVTPNWDFVMHIEAHTRPIIILLPPRMMMITTWQFETHAVDRLTDLLAFIHSFGMSVASLTSWVVQPLQHSAG